MTDDRVMASSVDELLAWFGEITSRELLTSDDSKSGARIERLLVDGEPYVLKRLHLADDWVMRATGDLTCRQVMLWRGGWMDLVPPCIDHAVVGAARDERPDSTGAAVLMRDVGKQLVPAGDAVIPDAQHLAFLDHMAQLHAAFWDQPDTLGLLPMSQRLVFFGPRLGATEQARGGDDVVPTQLVPHGWRRFAARAPAAAPAVFALLDDPTALVSALEASPQTLVHGDWKAGNLGSHPDGRTVLLDWTLPGMAPACIDVAWYVCLNRARLPQGKEATFSAYRGSLERHGIDTEPWWERQLGLCLLGLTMLFGWEKALGDDDEAADELAWWEARAVAGAEQL